MHIEIIEKANGMKVYIEGQETKVLEDLPLQQPPIQYEAGMKVEERMELMEKMVRKCK